MPNQADMLLAVPQIKPKFLEELLEILGTPDYIIFRVPNSLTLIHEERLRAVRRL